ncbi:MAG TPA: cupin domain-containing protein [Iamia sp.]|nr:cupin domain-containing protein [Iamia sp.]
MSDDSTTPALAATWDTIPGEDVRPGVSRKGFGTQDVILVMNTIQPDMQPAPHTHDDFDQIATIVSGEAVYHVGDVAHRVSAGALLLIPAGVEHWIEPVGDRPVENLDVFAPARSDYAHLLDWTRSAAGADPT